jgi:hypothetical protein
MIILAVVIVLITLGVLTLLYFVDGNNNLGTTQSVGYNPSVNDIMAQYDLASDTGAGWDIAVAAANTAAAAAAANSAIDQGCAQYGYQVSADRISCVCNPPRVAVNGYCVRPTDIAPSATVCTGGQFSISGQCVCPRGRTFSGGQCVVTPNTCKLITEIYDPVQKKCVSCPNGGSVFNGRCMGHTAGSPQPAPPNNPLPVPLEQIGSVPPNLLPVPHTPPPVAGLGVNIRDPPAKRSSPPHPNAGNNRTSPRKAVAPNAGAGIVVMNRTSPRKPIPPKPIPPKPIPPKPIPPKPVQNNPDDNAGP